MLSSSIWWRSKNWLQIARVSLYRKRSYLRSADSNNQKKTSHIHNLMRRKNRSKIFISKNHPSALWPMTKHCSSWFLELSLRKLASKLQQQSMVKSPTKKYSNRYILIRSRLIWSYLTLACRLPTDTKPARWFVTSLEIVSKTWTGQAIHWINLSHFLLP